MEKCIMVQSAAERKGQNKGSPYGSLQTSTCFYKKLSPLWFYQQTLRGSTANTQRVKGQQSQRLRGKHNAVRM